jgi:nicotinate-nucleotide pyrophosphorylase (carboxylating)
MNGPTLPSDLEDSVTRALAEDIGPRDVTALLVPDLSARATIITREDAVLAGRPYVDAVFRRLDPLARLEWSAADGDAVQANQVLCRLELRARALLTGERSALNFLQLLSGTATITRRYVDAIASTGCRILDTRKTLPGLRLAQKYAVRCGGGTNHRLGLYDRVLLKENHIMAAGSIAAAVAAARALPDPVPVEVETENLDEFTQALDAGADYIMLDEYSLDDMRSAVARNRAHPRRALLEASGSVTLDELRGIAATGVDFISVGSITKHVRALDLSLRVLR